MNNSLPDSFRLTTYTSSQAVPKAQLQACLALVSKIKHMYRASGMGWSVRRKKDEFAIDGMVFLIISDRRDSVAAFASVLPRTLQDYDSSDDDDDAEPVDEEDPSLYVSYLYELHVDPRYQGRGFARTLLDAAKSICVAQAHPRAVSKLMLNVFNMNVPAQNFYLWAGFKYHDDTDTDTADADALLPAGFISAPPPPPPPPRSSAMRQKPTDSTHKLHPDLRYTQMHRSVQGWTEMVWAKP